MSANNTILFVCEGASGEPDVLKKISKSFNFSCKQIIVVFSADIHQFYRKISADPDLVLIDLLRDSSLSNKTKLNGISNKNISEIYLFFDSDLHASAASPDNLKAMVDLFHDETSDHGKLYLSYPMLEAWKHIKNDPNFDYNQITYPIRDTGYKQHVHENTDFKYIAQVSLEDWKFIFRQNVIKANFLVNNCTSKPSYNMFNHHLNQSTIFINQKNKHIPLNRVAVLSGFPFFVLEYFGEKLYDDIL